MKKAAVLALIDAMPDETDLEDLKYQLFIVERRAQSEREYAAGQFATHEAFSRETDQSLSFSG